MKFTENDHKRIQDCLTNVEKRTSGEIVPMIIPRSDEYPAANWRLACLLMIQTPIIYYFIPFSFQDESSLIVIQVIAMAIGYFLAEIPFLKRIFTSKREMNEEITQRTMQAFLDNNLHSTRDRNGILIMVSLLERRVEILADTGINNIVSLGTWSLAIPLLTKKLREGLIIDGMIECIEYCGDELEKHFPIKHDDTNELHNKLVTE